MTSPQDVIGIATRLPAWTKDLHYAKALCPGMQPSVLHQMPMTPSGAVNKALSFNMGRTLIFFLDCHVFPPSRPQKWINK